MRFLRVCLPCGAGWRRCRASQEDSFLQASGAVAPFCAAGSCTRETRLGRLVALGRREREGAGWPDYSGGPVYSPLRNMSHQGTDRGLPVNGSLRVLGELTFSQRIWRCVGLAARRWRRAGSEGSQKRSSSPCALPRRRPARTAVDVECSTLDPGGNGCLRPVLKHGPRSLATARVRG